jgi:hypothetical protein
MRIPFWKAPISSQQVRGSPVYSIHMHVDVFLVESIPRPLDSNLQICFHCRKKYDVHACGALLVLTINA